MGAFDPSPRGVGTDFNTELSGQVPPAPEPAASMLGVVSAVIEPLPPRAASMPMEDSFAEQPVSKSVSAASPEAHGDGQWESAAPTDGGGQWGSFGSGDAAVQSPPAVGEKEDEVPSFSAAADVAPSDQDSTEPESASAGSPPPSAFSLGDGDDNDEDNDFSGFSVAPPPDASSATRAESPPPTLAADPVEDGFGEFEAPPVAENDSFASSQADDEFGGFSVPPPAGAADEDEVKSAVGRGSSRGWEPHSCSLCAPQDFGDFGGQDDDGFDSFSGAAGQDEDFDSFASASAPTQGAVAPAPTPPVAAFTPALEAVVLPAAALLGGAATLRQAAAEALLKSLAGASDDQPLGCTSQPMQQLLSQVGRSFLLFVA